MDQHQSNGQAERAVQSVRKLANCLSDLLRQRQEQRLEEEVMSIHGVLGMQHGEGQDFESLLEGFLMR